MKVMKRLSQGDISKHVEDWLVVDIHKSSANNWHAPLLVWLAAPWPFFLKESTVLHRNILFISWYLSPYHIETAPSFRPLTTYSLTLSRDSYRPATLLSLPLKYIENKHEIQRYSTRIGTRAAPALLSFWVSRCFIAGVRSFPRRAPESDLNVSLALPPTAGSVCPPTQDLDVWTLHPIKKLLLHTIPPDGSLVEI